MSTKISIAGAGICCQDYIITSPRVEWGDTAQVSGYHVQGGGLVGTAMVACARLGAQCDIYGLLGADSIADEITGELQREGVQTTGLRKIDGGHSSFSFIHVDEANGDRTIFHRPSSGLSWSPTFDLNKISSAQVLIIDDYFIDLSMAAAQEARQHGVPVVADLCPEPRNLELLRWVDVLIAPKSYARQIGCEQQPDAALDHIHSLGPTTAVITLGGDGYIYSSPSACGQAEAFKVKAVDTTGAGDSFHGAFGFAIASGWDCPRSAEFASAVAAIKCTQPGGRSGLPSLEQTRSFLQQHGRLDWSVITP